LTNAAYELLDPVSETLVAAGRRRDTSPVDRRVALARWLSATLLLATAFAFAVAVPSSRDLPVGTLLLLTVA